jgi:CubicO group peptidase (beta-lactamase class C family)
MEMLTAVRNCLSIGGLLLVLAAVYYAVIFVADWFFGWHRSAASMGAPALILAAAMSVVFISGHRARGAPPEFDLKDPQPALEAVRKAHSLPALGAAIVTVDGLQLLTTTGVRRKGDETPVTDDDLWHLGSCGKAMTATMIARLVERGVLRFEQTLGESFPQHAATMSDDVKSIRLVDLLSHTSGLPDNYDVAKYRDKVDPVVSREKVLVETLTTKLASKPGAKYAYSNWGYTLAGHVAEQATGKSWEDLMRQEVFEPLGMTTAGFGGTGTVGKIDQPWPHSAWGLVQPFNGTEVDNPPVMGPAGTIHMSLADWGKFVAEHLRGRAGTSEFLKQATFERLHTAIKDDYALGWLSVERPWGGGLVITHSGDNTLNHATVWAAPKLGFAVLVVTNQSSASAANDAVAGGLIGAWTGEDEPAKRAPFNAIRWENEQPVVRIGEEWLTLESIDGVAAAEIVKFCRDEYDDKWQKRFGEDLVEVLMRMGHAPGDAVTLVVRAGEGEGRTLADVPMTRANRDAVWEAGARE